MKSAKLLKRYGHGRKDTLVTATRCTSIAESYFLFCEIHIPIKKDANKGIEYVIVVKYGVLVPVCFYAYTAHLEEKDGKLFLVPDKGEKTKKHRYTLEYCNTTTGA